MKRFGYKGYNMMRENQSVDLETIVDMDTLVFRAG